MPSLRHPAFQFTGMLWGPLPGCVLAQMAGLFSGPKRRPSVAGDWLAALVAVRGGIPLVLVTEGAAGHD